MTQRAFQHRLGSSAAVFFQQGLFEAAAVYTDANGQGAGAAGINEKDSTWH